MSTGARLFRGLSQRRKETRGTSFLCPGFNTTTDTIPAASALHGCVSLLSFDAQDNHLDHYRSLQHSRVSSHRTVASSVPGAAESAMALNGAQGVNGGSTAIVAIPSPAEEESFYTKLLGLADTVVSGKHAQFKLPPAAIEQLKASLALLNAPLAGGQQQVADNSLANGVAYSANAATNAQQYSTPTTSTFPGLPGLQPQQPHFVNSAPPSLTKATSGGLNPIFLEKSEVLVKAENRHKRQHIERDLQSQAAQSQGKRPGRDDQGAEAPSLDMNAIMLASAARELHVSGLKQSGRVDSEAASFDTNDYYSSQVESDWPSPESKGSDRAAGAVPADFESFGGPSGQSSFAKTFAMGKQPAVARGDHTSHGLANEYSAQLRNAYEVMDDDEDDEYTPPDVSALAGHDDDAGLEEGQIGSDDDDDYEPGEVTMDSNVPTPPQPARQVQQYSPKVIRNHLTHIAAPQPNRVSPLAVAKGPNLGGELELVNGRPEVVSHKYSARHNPNVSRASTVSPDNGLGGVNNKKRRPKKRKRDNEQQQAGGGRAKKKRERRAAPPSPAYHEPRIKDEPMSPPPFANIPEAQPFAQYAQRPAHYRPAEIDLVSPRHIPLPPSPYVPDPRTSGLRYEYAQPASPSAARVASPVSFRPVQRDTQDLRRVASMHYAQRPASPAQRTYSPAPQRTASMTYGDPRMSQAPVEVRYQEPPRAQDYHDPYGRRPQSPAVFNPPTAARKIVIDQYGNQYYAAEPEPAPAPPPPSYRASVAPVDRRPPPPAEVGYERAPSRAATAYAQPAYERADARMGPPPPKRRAVEEPAVQYVDANGYPVPMPEYSRPEVRYMEAPTSPVFQAPHTRYEMAPPPPRAAREPTSPVYAEPTSPAYAPTRSYSVRPEAPPAPQYSRQASVVPQQYARQASVAPQQYARPEAAPAPPARAMSVVPGYEQQPRAQLYAPAPQQQVRYVDQYGRDIVYQSDPRQAPPPPTEYRYQ